MERRESERFPPLYDFLIEIAKGSRIHAATEKKEEENTTALRSDAYINNQMFKIKHFEGMFSNLYLFFILLLKVYISSIIIPYLQYSEECWGNTYKTNLQCL